MYQSIVNYIQTIEDSFDSISDERKELLNSVAHYVKGKVDSGETVKLNFICTHNSRRSHLAQIWTSVAAHHFGIENVETYSGGTEATAFNPRAVAAIERAGFQVMNPGGDNPRYEISFADGVAPVISFSKKFDDAFNPTSGFAAIMTCSDADENCPFVPGTEFRASTTYIDPKVSDGTLEEAQTYDERCKQIATEMFFMMGQVEV